MARNATTPASGQRRKVRTSARTACCSSSAEQIILHFANGDNVLAVASLRAMDGVWKMMMGDVALFAEGRGALVLAMMVLDRMFEQWFSVLNGVNVSGV